MRVIRNNGGRSLSGLEPREKEVINFLPYVIVPKLIRNDRGFSMESEACTRGLGWSRIIVGFMQGKFTEYMEALWEAYVDTEPM